MTLVRIVTFAAGALLGGGVATVVFNRQRALSTRSLDPPSQTLAPLSAISPNDLPILKYGNPGVCTFFFLRPDSHRLAGPIADLLVRKVYVAAYDRRLRHPAWVRLFHIPAVIHPSFTLLYPHTQTAQHLTLASLGRSTLEPSAESVPGDRSQSVFLEDISLPVAFRSKLKDYFKSGYDRGHMCVVPFTLVFPITHHDRAGCQQRTR
jgi:endonuclease G, mitochondrial